MVLEGVRPVLEVSEIMQIMVVSGALIIAVVSDRETLMEDSEIKTV